MTDGAPDRIARGARLVTAGILFSRVLGLVRFQAFAYFLTGTYQGDAYNAALRIPNVLRNLLGEGAISASFIPVYAAALERGDTAGARAVANALLGVLLAGVAVLSLAGIALAPVLSALLISGASAETAELTTRLMRVLFPMTGLMVLSGWCLGVQNAHRRFFLAYASAALWSLAQIALLVIGGPRAESLTELAWWLAWATLIGAVLQVAAQAPQVWRLMTGIRPTLALATPGLKAVLVSWVPVVSTLGLAQISSFVDLQIASWLPEGAITSMTFAQQLYLLPLSLFGVATAAAALPELARESVREGGGAAAGLSAAAQRVLFYTVPSAVAFVAIGSWIVALIYRGGTFGDEAQRIVHLVLAAYAIGLTAYALARVLVSAFQAQRDYRTPLVAAAFSVATGAAVAVALALPFRDRPLAVAGIAVGSAVGANVNLCILWLRLRARLGATLDLRAAGFVGSRALAAALVAAAAGVATGWLLGGVPVKLAAVAVVPAYGVTFLVVARAMGLDEAGRLLGSIRRRVGGGTR